MLPNFLVIGAQKGGTTWIAKNLSKHPDVYIHYYPELNFFNVNIERGIDWYKSFFPDDGSVIGEKSPAYLASSDTPKRIRSILPDAKLIVSLRNPVTRAISAIKFYRKIGKLSLFKGIDKFLNDLLDGKHLDFENQYKTLWRGKYINTLPPYYELFPSKNILLLIYEEDIKQNPISGMKKICDFISVPYKFSHEQLRTPINTSETSYFILFLNQYSPLPNKINNKIAKILPYIPVKDEIRQHTFDKLYEYYHSSNEQLFQYLGRRIEGWESI
jgi:hypothetical protein